MSPFPVMAVPVPLVAGILLFHVVAGDTPVPRRGGGYDRSRRRKRIVAGVTTPSARAHRRRDALGQAVRGDRVSRSAPEEDVPVPRRGGPRSPSWRGIRPLAEEQTRPGGSYNSLRKGTPPPQGPWAHSSRGRAWAGSARRPRTQVSPQRGFRCAPRGRTRGWRAPGLPHQQPSAPSRCHPAATTVPSRHEGSRHRGQSR